MTSVIDPADLPAALRDSMARHQSHVMTLIASLHSAGVDEAMIERSVQEVVASYQAELLPAIRALVRADAHV